MRSPGALTLASAPLVAGALVPLSAVDGDAVWCPFRAVTGLPCPLCGATRAFVHAGHLDGRWVDFGAVWVVVAVALLVAGLLGLRVPRGRAATLALAGVAVVAWAWALAHAGTIAPPG